MLRLEDVRRCVVCDELTPHSRHLLPLFKLAAAASILTAVLYLAARRAMVGWGLLILSFPLYLKARRHPRHIHCNRCRERGLRALRRTRPTPDGHTTIDIL